MNSKNDSLSEALLDAVEEKQLASALGAFAKEEGEALLNLNEELSELSKYQLSSKTKRQFLRALRKTVPAQKRFVRRTVLLISALLTVLLFACTAWGHSVFDFLLREFTGYASVSNDHSNNNSTNYYCVLGDLPSPTYLPGGYQYSSHQDSGQASITEYIDHEGNVLAFSQFSGPSQLLLDTDSLDQKQSVRINEEEGTVLFKNGRYNLIWGSSPQYQLIGNCALEELIKMAISVAV